MKKSHAKIIAKYGIDDINDVRQCYLYSYNLACISGCCNKLDLCEVINRVKYKSGKDSFLRFFPSIFFGIGTMAASVIFMAYISVDLGLIPSMLITLSYLINSAFFFTWCLLDEV